MRPTVTERNRCPARFGTMPHYYFHIHNGSGLTPDEEGQDLPGLREAHACALTGIRSLLAGEVDEGGLDLNGRLEITDATGNPVRTVLFAEAVEVRPPGPEGR